MFSLSYKNRIAFHYILSTALLISLVFFVIFQTISFRVYEHTNDDLHEEIKEYKEEIKLDTNNTYLIQVDQWNAHDNNTVNVNPVFVQFFDLNNELIDKSPNLKGLELKLNPSKFDNQYYDTFLNNKLIRQVQVPLIQNNKKIGYLIVAMSLDETKTLISNFRDTLIIAFPLILIVLFITARFIAGRSIAPVTTITETSSKITKDNLSARIDLPENKDELYVLSKTINDLLDRMEMAVEREKQFTSDASHELRTPLTVLKGTLEVLIRKPRTQAEYEDKIKSCISEVNRLNNLVDQLLLLSRFENQKQSLKIEKVYLNAIILDSLTLYSDEINLKKIKIIHPFSTDYVVDSDNYLVSIVISNILSNAIKYSNESGLIAISISENKNATTCTITDTGIGISADDLNKISNPFYRSNPTNHPDIKGYGLGLSIVKRVVNLLNIEFKIESEINKGTTVTLSFLNKY